MNRREALKLAAAIGASLAWKPALASLSGVARIERRDLFPEGVASGDPRADSIAHHVPRWSTGEEPTLERKDLEGTPPLLA